MGQGRGEGLEGGTKSRLGGHQKSALCLPPPFQGRALPWLSPGSSKTPLLPCPGQSLPSEDAYPVTAAPKWVHILPPSSLQLGLLLLSPSSATPSSPWMFSWQSPITTSLVFTLSSKGFQIHFPFTSRGKKGWRLTWESSSPTVLPRPSCASQIHAGRQRRCKLLLTCAVGTPCRAGHKQAGCTGTFIP